MKKLFLILSAAAIIWLLPISSGAEVVGGNNAGYYGSDNISWSLDTETGILTLTGSGIMADSVWMAAIPWTPWRYYIEKLVVEDGITVVGRSIFSLLPELKEVILPQSLEEIRPEAFDSCHSLTSVTFQNTDFLTIGKYAFFDCYSLTELNFNGSGEVELGPSSFVSGDFYTLNLPGTVHRIGTCAFSGCDSLTKVTIGEGTAMIDDAAFSACPLLSEVSLPASLRSFGENVLDDCAINKIELAQDNKYFILKDGALFSMDGTQLYCVPSTDGRTEFTIPEGVTRICGSAFERNATLEKVSLPSTLTSIGSYAFSLCGKLTCVDLPEGLTEIDSDAFGHTGLTEVSLPSTLKKLGSYAFWRSPIGSITLPDGLISMGKGVFTNCQNLTEVALPDSLEDLGDSMFMGCTGLKTVILPANMTEIPRDMFIRCTALEALTLPPTVTKIDFHAFSDCTSLKSLTLPDNITDISLYAFEGTNIDLCFREGSVTHRELLNCGIEQSPNIRLHPLAE